MRALPRINRAASLVDTRTNVNRPLIRAIFAGFMTESTRTVPRIASAADLRRSASLKVLIILGHPRKDSLCGALADAYAAGAEEAGVNIKRLYVGAMAFNPNVIAGSPRNQVTEPSIAEAMELLEWADHIVFVFPTWWGTMPAALKGFLDRVLMPGFALLVVSAATW